MKKEQLPESATLDHTKVKAPYVRTAGIISVTSAKRIYKYDIRFLQPNTGLIPTDIVHSLEHLLAVTMRRYLNGIIDISPMGCLTGFYLVALNQPYERILVTLEKALQDILSFEAVPFANEIQCGSPKHHDLLGAKKYAQFMLEGRNNWKIGAETHMNLSCNVELH